MADYTKYPGQIDTSNELPIATDNVTPVKAEVVNRLRSAIIAIESELGVNPSSTFSTVKARIDALESTGGSGGGGTGLISVYDNGAFVSNRISEVNFVNGTINLDAVNRISFTVDGYSSQKQETLTVSTNGQASFTLSQTPADSTAVHLYLNGIKQQYGIDYTVSNKTISYTGVSLLTTDKLEVWYLISGQVIGAGSSASEQIVSKIRVERTASNLAGSTAGAFQTAIFNTVSAKVVKENSDLSGSNIRVIATTSPTPSGTFAIQGQLTIAPSADAVSGIIIKVNVNGVEAHTITDYGSVWGVGIERSFNFNFIYDLITNDSINITWAHTGSSSSSTNLIFGANKTWLSFHRLSNLSV